MMSGFSVYVPCSASYGFPDAWHLEFVVALPVVSALLFAHARLGVTAGATGKRRGGVVGGGELLGSGALALSQEHAFMLPGQTVRYAT